MKKCKTCGLDKDLEQFAINRNVCRRCVSINVGKVNQARNSTAMEHAVNARQHWSKHELAQLQRRLNTGMSIDDVAKLHGRSYMGIVGAQGKHRIFRQTYTAIPGQPIDMDFIRTYLKEAS